MGCGCRKNRTTTASTIMATDSATRQMYEVFTSGGQPTGRRFNSIISAQSYAARINGEVRVVS